MLKQVARASLLCGAICTLHLSSAFVVSPLRSRERRKFVAFPIPLTSPSFLPFVGPFHQLSISQRSTSSLQAVEHASGIMSSSLVESTSLLSVPAPLAELWREYNVVLDAHPLYTKMATSLVGFIIGDWLAQTFVERTESYDPIRTLRAASFGVLIHATSGHYFYGFMDRTFPGTAASTIATKVAIDQICWAPIFTAWFFGYNFLLEGKSFEEYILKLKSDLVTGVRGSWSFWAPAHAINFAFIPPPQRLLYINVLQIIYNIFLSFLGNKNVDGEDDGSSGGGLMEQQQQEEALGSVVEKEPAGVAQ